MLKPLLVSLFLLLVPSTMAAEWKYEGGSVPIAYVDNGPAQFQFACRGGDLAMGYWVKNPNATIASAQAMSLAINASGAEISSGGSTSFAQDFPLIHSDGTSMIIRGPVARQWAQIAQRAGETIRLGYIRTKSGGGLDIFDAHSFSAKGSSAAIAKVLVRCG